ncbi:MAG: hydroxyquinol 1,2-dioxygenase [Deltaproteobacteria bacterium]|jgi:hypothetical protein|nr:MAG: hydroxyquinol 1,2-dioxygenase [Deltaproteobacteria bacterium]
MGHYTTVMGSLEKFERGHLSIIDDDPKHYCYSNVFEVASKSRPYGKIAVAKNLDYVIEAIRAEGTSDWFAANHDEFVVVMDGEVTISFVEPGDSVVSRTKDGTQRLSRPPNGKKMGRIHLKRGHQALLPKGAAYQFSAARPSVMIQQTILGDLTQQKWAEICTH